MYVYTCKFTEYLIFKLICVPVQIQLATCLFIVVAVQ